MARRPHRHASTDQRTALPDDFRTRMGSLLGEEIGLLEEALRAPSPTSIRLNPTKPFDPRGEQVPWCATGRYLAERPSFTFDPLLHAGAYYVQEASSMLLEQAVNASGVRDRDVCALDLCAAPGGKSTHLLSLLSHGSFLVANEVDAARRNILAENIWKSGAGNVAIAGSHPAELDKLPSFFDLILVDAPCSGEGMFRKDPHALRQWTPALVANCAATQGRILEHAWNALAPGGTLIYSTCTWEPSENEERLLPLIAQGAVPVELPVDPTWGVVRSEWKGALGYRCYPHRVRGEGFFLAVVRKPGEPRPRRENPVLGGRWSDINWLAPTSHATLAETGGILYAAPDAWRTSMATLCAALAVKSPGVPFAEPKGGTWTPHPAAALSTWLLRGALPEVALTRAQALSFLRGEAIPATAAQGPALATHAGLGLGWLQGAGNRWNNRWPAPWRIRSQRSAAPDVPWSEQAGDRS